MMKILVTVGTSIFDNYLREGNSSPVVNILEKVGSTGGCSATGSMYAKQVDELKRDIEKWIRTRRGNFDFSAEIKSLYQILRELKEKIEKEGGVQIYFLTSDTILGKLAGDILKDYVKNDHRNFCEFNVDAFVYCIESLRVESRREFYRGVSNLITKVFEIAGGYWDNIIFNITGGYKATVPFMVTLAYFYKRPVYYIFEDTDALVKIPQIPLREDLLDAEKLQPYEEWLCRLKEGIWGDGKKFDELKKSDFYKEFSHLIETDEDDKIAILNPIGVLILHVLKENYFCFCATDEVISAIEKDSRLKEILERKLWKYLDIGQKVELKNGHFVYDDGDTPFRVFFRRLDSSLMNEFESNIKFKRSECTSVVIDEPVYCIYKVFSDHREYEDYLDKKTFTVEILLQNSFKRYCVKKIKSTKKEV